LLRIGEILMEPIDPQPDYSRLSDEELILFHDLFEKAMPEGFTSSPDGE